MAYSDGQPIIGEVGGFLQADVQQLLDKVKSTPARPNQLAAPMAGVAPGGSLSLRLAAGSTPTRAALDAEIGRIAGQLPAKRVRQVLDLTGDTSRFEATPIHRFMEIFTP